jgi:hypothetical protein
MSRKRNNFPEFYAVRRVKCQNFDCRHSWIGAIELEADLDMSDLEEREFECPRCKTMTGRVQDTIHPLYRDDATAVIQLSAIRN